MTRVNIRSRRLVMFQRCYLERLVSNVLDQVWMKMSLWHMPSWRFFFFLKISRDYTAADIVNQKQVCRKLRWELSVWKFTTVLVCKMVTGSMSWCHGTKRQKVFPTFLSSAAAGQNSITHSFMMHCKIWYRSKQLFKGLHSSTVGCHWQWRHSK